MINQGISAVTMGTVPHASLYENIAGINTTLERTISDTPPPFRHMFQVLYTLLSLSEFGDFFPWFHLSYRRMRVHILHDDMNNAWKYGIYKREN
jgi:hypothetical protein